MKNGRDFTILIFLIIFHQTLSFKQRIKTLCKKASQELHALVRISCHMDTEKLKQVMQALVLSHFSCSPLVWTFYDRTLNHRINHIHERTLCFAYKDCQTDFGSLMEQRHLVSIHVQNLQLLMTEIYKTRSGLSPPFMKDICTEWNADYDLRHGNNSQFPKCIQQHMELKLYPSFPGYRLWSTLPNIIKQATTLPIFKSH